MKNEIKCPKCGEIFQVDESLYSAIVKQVKDKEFSKEIKNREIRFEKEKESLIQLTKLELEKAFNKELSSQSAEIDKLKTALKAEQLSKKSEVNEITSQKEKEILKIKNQLDSFNKDKTIEIANIMADMSNKLFAQEKFIMKLTSENELAEKEFKLKEQSLKEHYEEKLRFKNEEIARYKDFKARLSTKMIGESLEQHCETEFNKLRATGFQNAYFEKDNDVKKGSKGDYIYRESDTESGEFISIMFEMKNEADTTSTKKKNEDFLMELDKDRREKKCEYAVLVSMIEPESELYNSGIVDMSHRFEKMYVIRPQFFIPVITMLRNVALNALKYRRKLA